MTGTVSARWGFVDDSALNYMVDRISAGQCILFVGAGLAQTCEDDHGIKGPSATELARLVSTRFLGRNEVQDNLPLAADYSLAFHAKYDIDSFIRQKLIGGLKFLGRPSSPKSGVDHTANSLEGHLYDQLRCSYRKSIRNCYQPETTSPADLQQFDPALQLIHCRRAAGTDIPLYKLHGCISRIILLTLLIAL